MGDVAYEMIVNVQLVSTVREVLLINDPLKREVIVQKVITVRRNLKKKHLVQLVNIVTKTDLAKIECFQMIALLVTGVNLVPRVQHLMRTVMAALYFVHLDFIAKRVQPRRMQPKSHVIMAYFHLVMSLALN